MGRTSRARLKTTWRPIVSSWKRVEGVAKGHAKWRELTRMCYEEGGVMRTMTKSFTQADIFPSWIVKNAKGKIRQLLP